MKLESMLVTLYSVDKLSEETRKDFSLFGDPYEDDADSLEYLKGLGVFHYRDEEHSEAVVIPRDDFDVFEEVGFEAYKSTVSLGKNLEVLTWPEGKSAKAKRLHDKYIKEHDEYQWLIWNEHCVVREVDEMYVSVS